jgi:hypothetical protein
VEVFFVDLIHKGYVVHVTGDNSLNMRWPMWGLRGACLNQGLPILTVISRLLFFSNHLLLLSWFLWLSPLLALLLGTVVWKLVI